jgi:hypothetical protein
VKKCNLIQIFNSYLAKTIVFCGSVDRDEDEVSLFDGSFYVGGEEEVLAAAGFDNVIKTRLWRKRRD